MRARGRVRGRASVHLGPVRGAGFAPIVAVERGEGAKQFLNDAYIGRVQRRAVRRTVPRQRRRVANVAQDALGVLAKAVEGVGRARHDSTTNGEWHGDITIGRTPRRARIRCWG